MTMGELGKGFTPHWLSEGWAALREQAHNAITHFHHDDELSGATGPVQVQRWGVVAADIVDHGDHLEVRMELPGLTKKDIHVEVTGGRLSVTGEKRIDSSRKQGNAVISERAFGQFQRVFSLPSDVEAGKASASYKDGILAIDLPKSGTAAASRVKVE